MKKIVFLSVIALILSFTSKTDTPNTWSIDSESDWKKALKDQSNIELNNGQSKSTNAVSKFSSIVKRYKEKRSIETIEFKQSTVWDNWKEIPNVGAKEICDAQVFIPVKEGDYWLLGAYGPYQSVKQKGGAWKKSDLNVDNSQLGYHAWHSTDMVHWKHHGPVSEKKSRWVTTAEYVDGKFYIYYDNPNDEDPHLIIDDDLSDGIMGEDLGMVFSDPSHGSDCAIFKEEDGSFHLIYENWDHIDARTHSFDSPVAGHAISKDGIHDFKIVAPAVDDRTTPTGKMGEYTHRPNGKTPLKYEIHTPEQNAYGDWTAIKVGGQYYLFCDYDPVGENIKIGKWTSNSLDNEFSFSGSFGGGHPDPTVGFANGQFYLLQQRGEVDFISPGPWVEGVEVRVGVDTSGDGEVNQWTNWEIIKEQYKQKENFIRIVETTPASMDISSLPQEYGFAFEYRTKSIKGQKVNVIMEKVKLSFK